MAAGIYGSDGAYDPVQPGAGHYPWPDDADWFVRRVVAFLGGSGRRTV